MLKKTAFWILVLLAGCGPLSHGLNSRTGDLQPNRKARATARTFDTAPFDLARTKLPSAYEGHDIMKVYSSFEQGTARGTEVFAFRVSLAPGAPGNELSHDEDRRVFTTRIQIEPFWDSAGNVEQNRVSFMIAGYSGTSGSESSNERGASQRRWLLWEVSVSSDQDFRKRAKADRSGAFLAMEAPEPPQYRSGEISALLVCRPRSSSEGFSTTVGSPPVLDGRGFMHYYLKSDLLELWMYDYRTGRILGKDKIAAPRP